MSAAPGIFAHWPNRITAARFAGALVLFVLFAVVRGDTLSEGERATIHVAFWLFVAVALTDWLDGWLARRGGQITAFGRVADPFVDKVLVLGTMVFLAARDWSDDWIPAWIVVVVMAREFLVTGLRGYVESLGLPFPADWFGKMKMLSQCIAIGVVLGMHAFDLVIPFWSAVAHVFVWATLLASVGSGLSYVLKTRRMLAGAST